MIYANSNPVSKSRKGEYYIWSAMQAQLAQVLLMRRDLAELGRLGFMWGIWGEHPRYQSVGDLDTVLTHPALQRAGILLANQADE